MKPDIKKLLICLATPLVTGGLSALFSGGMEDFRLLNAPPLSPPGWLFPIVWTVLYLLMGYASYRVLTSGKSEENIKNALKLYGIQLFFNFFWSILFFGFGWRLVAFIWLIGLWIAIYLTMRKFSEIDELSSDLLIPYILWVTFAGYLNLGYIVLN